MTTRPLIKHRQIPDITELSSSCVNCRLQKICVSGGVSTIDLERMDSIVGTRRLVRKNESLYHTGDLFSTLYAIRTGTFKVSMTLDDGREQTVGFHLPGELLGLDGVEDDTHQAQAIALEDSNVCLIPFDQFERIAGEFPTLQHQLNRVMSREIVRDQKLLISLGSMRAAEKIAAFLINLSHRYLVLGYSPLEFHLRMRRADIASFLGLTVESVSRVLTRFQEEELIALSGKRIRLLDLPALRATVSASTLE